MATQAEILSRGQASRNWQMASKKSRAGVALGLIALAAVVGAGAGWRSAPHLTRSAAWLYTRAHWSDLKDPFARNQGRPPPRRGSVSATSY